MVNKQEFLDQLRLGLAGLPKDDIDERIAFYSEIIDDRIDEGLSEADAVAQIGTVEEVVSQILDETPLTKLVKERITPKKKIPVWAIVLIILGSPIWLAILLSLLAIFIAIYVVIWAVIAALWAIDIAFVLSSVCGILAGIYYMVAGRATMGLLLLSVGLVLAGFTILLFFGCKLASKGAVVLTRKIFRGIKTLFLRKEEA